MVFKTCSLAPWSSTIHHQGFHKEIEGHGKAGRGVVHHHCQPKLPGSTSVCRIGVGVPQQYELIWKGSMALGSLKTTTIRVYHCPFAEVGDFVNESFQQQSIFMVLAGILDCTSKKDSQRGVGGFKIPLTPFQSWTASGSIETSA